MKVGVLTYHSANNYGTCLQCYALMHLVEQAGYDCDVIDYRGEKLSNSPVCRPSSSSAERPPPETDW